MSTTYTFRTVITSTNWRFCTSTFAINTGTACSAIGTTANSGIQRISLICYRGSVAVVVVTPLARRPATALKRSSTNANKPGVQIFCDACASTIMAQHRKTTLMADTRRTATSAHTNPKHKTLLTFYTVDFYIFAKRSSWC